MLQVRGSRSLASHSRETLSLEVKIWIKQKCPCHTFGLTTNARVSPFLLGVTVVPILAE